MSSLNSTLPLNTTLVHPPFFFIRGLQYVPNAKYLYIFLCFIFVVSVLGNSFIMFIVYTESSLHTPKYMAIFNLAVADVGSSTALIPNLVATFLFDSHYISFHACLANMFFVYYFNFIISLTLTILAYDRLVAIFLPLRYHSIITMPSMAVILTVLWIFIIIFMTLQVVLFTRMSFCKSIVVESYFCDLAATARLACNDIYASRILSYLEGILSLFLPIVLIVLSYMFIAGALFKITSWEGRLKAFKTCSAHLMAVAVYYFPSLFGIIVGIVVGFDPNTWIFLNLLSFSIPPMLNPIIYVLSTGEVKEIVKKIFQVRRVTSKLNK